MKIHAAVFGVVAVLIAVFAFPATALANASPQDHCDGAVCVGAESIGGHGPNIINAAVETLGLFPLPPGTVLYLDYGANPAAAKRAIPRYCISDSNNVSGCVFGIGERMNVGWVLCGEIVGYVGFPCIRIGA